MNINQFVSIGLLAALLLAPGLAIAQTPEEQQEAALAKMREALRTMTTQLRSAQAEVATAQAFQLEAEKKITSLEKQLKDTTQKADASRETADAAIQELKAALDKRTTENEQLRQTLAKWKTAYENAAQTATAKEGERAALAGRVVDLENDVATRERNNLELYRVGKEILERYENFGLGRALVAREPFTGLAKVSLENQIQGYDEDLLRHRDKIGQTPAVDPAPAPEATAGADSKPRQPVAPPRKQ